jgi:hypothetical protein
MANLISLGDMIVNLDQIAVLDIDAVPNRRDIALVRVVGNGASMETFVPVGEVSRMLELVDSAKRFSATDRTDT